MLTRTNIFLKLLSGSNNFTEESKNKKKSCTKSIFHNYTEEAELETDPDHEHDHAHDSEHEHEDHHDDEHHHHHDHPAQPKVSHT